MQDIEEYPNIHENQTAAEAARDIFTMIRSLKGGESVTFHIQGRGNYVDVNCSAHHLHCGTAETASALEDAYLRSITPIKSRKNKEPSRMQDLMDAAHEWSSTNFGYWADRCPNPIEQIIEHLKEEVKELADSPHDWQEIADVYMLLADLVKCQGGDADDLLDWTEDKLEINKKRNWSRNEDGGFRHVDEHYLCTHCKDVGWQWPNLGVSMPSGYGCTITQSSFWVRCKNCNGDGKKPMPPNSSYKHA